ncbi:MAG TPA: hypothetical protein VK102_00515 [Sphingobacterium sp.]|nr:hypothetical protein [Sphingobacterium sp.]
MSYTLYDPFESFTFDTKHCFLTGEPLKEDDGMWPVFPEWIMERYGLYDQQLKMFDDVIKNYGAIRVPVSAAAMEKLKDVDEKVRESFSKGFEAFGKLDQLTLFQWIGAWFYGVIFNEIQTAVRQATLTGEPMNFSQSLIHKFRNLNYMLQSLVKPMEFEHYNPFRIIVRELDVEKDDFMYRDEVSTLVFSLKMNNIGLIACLQDNGTNAKYHSEILEKTENKKLHPIQFEELTARFYYSAYLFSRLPDYTYLETPKGIFVEAMPLDDFSGKPMFDKWTAKTYSQVLESFWKPWAINMFEIRKNPEKPISFLLNESGDLVESNKVVCPDEE